MLRGRQRLPQGRHWRRVGGERDGGFALARRHGATAATMGEFSAASTPPEPCAPQRIRASRGERGTNPPPDRAAHLGATSDLKAAHLGAASDLMAEHLGLASDLMAAHLGVASDLMAAHLGVASDLIAARHGAAPDLRAVHLGAASAPIGPRSCRASVPTLRVAARPAHGDGHCSAATATRGAHSLLRGVGRLAAAATATFRPPPFLRRAFRPNLRERLRQRVRLLGDL